MSIIKTGMHCEWTVKAAKAGKHVLCEKPFAQTAEEVNQMIKACDENNVALMDGKHLRFRNSGSVLIIADSQGVMWSHSLRAKEMRKQLEEHKFGEVRQVIAKAVFPLTVQAAMSFSYGLTSCPRTSRTSDSRRNWSPWVV